MLLERIILDDLLEMNDSFPSANNPHVSHSHIIFSCSLEGILRTRWIRRGLQGESSNNGKKVVVVPLHKNEKDRVDLAVKKMKEALFAISMLMNQRNLTHRKHWNHRYLFLLQSDVDFGGT